MSRRSRCVLPLVLILLAGWPRGARAQEIPRGFEVVTRDEGFPTNLAFAPDGRVFLTERATGQVYRADPDFSPSPTPGRTGAPEAPGSAGLSSGAGLVVLGLLIGALLLIRARLNRRSGAS